MSADSAQSAFVRAVHTRDAAALRALLQRDGNARALIDEPLFSFDSPALAHISGDADTAVIDVLLEFGADPNRRTQWEPGGFHPLHSATGIVADRLIAAGAVMDACAAANLDRVDVLRALLDEDPARVHERGGDGQLPLHFARSRAAIDLLLERGADIDARDVDHRGTAAEWMLDHRQGAGRYALASYLVERGASTDIFLAAALGLTDRLRTMLAGNPALLALRTGQGDYDEKPGSSFHIYTWSVGQHLSPFDVAIQFDQPAAVDVMRAYATSKQLLLVACARGDTEQAHSLLRAQPTLAAELTRDDMRILADAGWAANTAAVRLMLDLGFDPAVPGSMGASVLHCAACEGVPECVETALRYPAVRALIETRDGTHGGTPLSWCCYGAVHSGNPRRDHAAVAAMLLDAGATSTPPLADIPEPVRSVIRARRPDAH
jgi:ankyrin repeat protein